MSFCSDHPVLLLIENQENEEAKLVIENENLFYAVLGKNNNTLLHYAAEYRNPEIMQFLIDSCCRQVNARNRFGQTPLMKSFETDSPCIEVIEILLKAGASIRLDHCSHQNPLNIVNSIAWLTKDPRRFEILKLFIEFGYDYYLCCLEVIIHGTKENIQSLLQTNVSLSKTDVLGRTLVHELARLEKPGFIELLRSRQFNANVYDKYGWTPLMYATTNGMPSAVEFLLTKGANIEATDDRKRTALYIAIFKASLENTKRIVQILLEHGANVQVIITDDDDESTIFDVILDNEEFELAELPLAQLAVQELLGTTVLDSIRRIIDSNDRFKSYYEMCQRKLSISVYPLITLFDLLTVSERKLEHYLRDKDLALKLKNFQTKIDYFDTLLSKRITKAKKMIALRKAATPIVCKLMEMDYESYPFVADQIVDYLEEQDMESLISIEGINCNSS